MKRIVLILAMTATVSMRGMKAGHQWRRTVTADAVKDCIRLTMGAAYCVLIFKIGLTLREGNKLGEINLKENGLYLEEKRKMLDEQRKSSNVRWERQREEYAELRQQLKSLNEVIRQEEDLDGS